MAKKARELGQPERAEQFAKDKAGELIATITKKPHDLAEHKRLLHDLKLSLCQEAAACANQLPDGALVWALAEEMPNFALQNLYRTRASLLSLGAAVFLGWLLGGFLATLLGFIGLGGEILRPAAILAALWVEEYLSVNPKARRVMLTVLGLGALGRFASALALGLVRFGTGGIGRLIFGSGARPNIFKAGWLWFGAIFLYVFFAKKITGLDVEAFRQDLQEQILERLRLASFFFAEAASLAQALRSQKQEERRLCTAQCAVAKTALSLLDSLDENKRKYLADSLRQAGFTVQDKDGGYLIWDDAIHPDQYNPLGLVKQGDKCLILARPYKAHDTFHKGTVQRVDS